MKLSDLRVGNWYMSVKFGVPVRCTLEDFYELYVLADGATSDPPIDQIFEPLPLTEDRVRSFGFEPHGIRRDYYLWYIHDTRLLFQMIDREDGFVYEHRVVLEYVHELQDLYRDLTNEELILNGKL